jgi:polyisoprenoid-binding protein YceI
MNLNHRFVSPSFVAISLLLASVASAAPSSFDFKDPKGVNNARFMLDAPLESISGTASGISGSIVYDPAQPAATTGRIVVAASSLVVGNPLMGEHLRSPNWLDVNAHPEIVFAAQRVSNVRSDSGRVTADVAGTLTIKGVSREITVPVSFTHLPDKLGARLGDAKLKGDLLVVRSEFRINRSDFGLQPGQMGDKVGEEIQITLSLAGAAPRA